MNPAPQTPPAESTSSLPRFPEPASRTGRKLLIFTDAWAPQVNGVVRTLETLGQDLRSRGWIVRYATPLDHSTLPLPTYPEIRLALFPRNRLARMIGEFAPDAIHIATEGTIGMSARAICIAQKLPFTTSFHTRFPEYVQARFPFVSTGTVYRFLRWFHAPATAIMVATPSLRNELAANGFKNLRIWTRGVDVEHFRPMADAAMPFPRPIWLYVGRIAVEKNVEAFLKLDLPGTKVVIGEGPARPALARAYPEAKFLGAKSGEDLVRHYSASDVFVFPSLTDTFGLVMLEALACGTPVAAFPVQGPRDVLGGASIAVLDSDLRRACMRALDISRSEARGFALTRSWRACTDQFLSNLPPGDVRTADKQPTCSTEAAL